LKISITENAQRIIDNSTNETKTAVSTLIAFFTQRMNKHEELEVLEWYAPYLFFDVHDTRWRHYPCNHRALVSFDVSNNQMASFQSENRNQFARKGWRKAITQLLGYEAKKYNDCGNKLVTRCH